MKKKISILFLLLTVCLLTSCKKEGENQIELLPATQEHFYYAGTEGTDRVAVDENGLLYTMEYISPEYTGPVVMEEGTELKFYKKISVYDLEGNCIKSELVEAGNQIVSNMILVNEVLYCVMGKSAWEYDKLTLYAIDTKDWSVIQVKQFHEYETMEYITVLGDYIYILGETKDEQLMEEEVTALDSVAYQHRNKKIIRLDYTTENSVSEQMQIDFPCALYCTERDTLMLYRYSPEKGYGFLEFDPARVTLTESEWPKTGVALHQLSDCGDGFLYNTFDDNLTYQLLFYGTMEGKSTQVLPEQVVLRSPAVYQKGFVFFIDASDNDGVERVCVEKLLQKDTALRVLKLRDNQDTPYECGYLTETIKLDSEAFALKVLAQDADFDVLLLNTRNVSSYNIKENGAFYSLNKVEGVQEYLDACFPYIKDLATDEDGNIWMIPVTPAVYGMIYNREFCAQKNVDFSAMDWAEFMELTAEIRKEDEELFYASIYMLKEQFLAQYLSKYNTFDTEEFRAGARQLREIVAEQGEWGIHLKFFNEIRNQGQIPEFYYEYIVSTGTINVYYDKLGAESARLGVSGLPKLSDGIGNVGTIAFMAVNPKSDNLETALDYISDFARYMVTKQNSFILEDKSMYDNTPFIMDAYEMYANAEVYFMMDTEVYWNDFECYLNGELELEEMIAEIERKYKLYVGE